MSAKKQEAASAEMEKLLGPKLLTKNGATQPTSSVLKGKEIVLLYFSASWCPPCKAFTPILMEFFNACAEESKFHIVFVSSDRDADSFNAYFAKMPWVAVPFDSASTKIKQNLADSLKVGGIPSLVVLDAKTGHYITDNGRNEVTEVSSDKEKCKALVQSWKSMEAVPFEEAKFGQGQPPFGIATIVSFLLRNPLYIFAMFYLVKKALKALAKLGKEDEEKEL